jgi:hypothetical protein
MKSLSHYLTTAGFVLVLMAAAFQGPHIAFAIDDDALSNNSGSVNSLCFCDGKFPADKDGIIKFPAGLPGCPCVWWHTLANKGMCGPCDFTCTNTRRAPEVPWRAPEPEHHEILE